LHHLGLARREQREALADHLLLGPPRAAFLVALERLMNAIDEILVAERLLDEVGRARLHGRDGHRHVTVARDEDNRYFRMLLVQPLLQLEAAHARHADVGHETRMAAGVVVFQELERRRMELAVEADRSQQQTERIAHRIVVVDEINQSACALQRLTPPFSVGLYRPAARR
jgi:hypothetical protein